jgi:hypothetical protein
MHRLLGSLLSVLTITLPTLGAEPIKQAPRLIVGIHIDQMKAEYLSYFKEGFSEDGFKKLLLNGLVYKSVSYDQLRPDAASASATLVTGASPSFHGIIGQQWYQRESGQVISCVQDPGFLGY